MYREETAVSVYVEDLCRMCQKKQVVLPAALSTYMVHQLQSRA